MAKHKARTEDQRTYEAECFECGIRLEPAELAEVDGETFCEQCAEEYLREADMHSPAASPDDPPSDRGARFH